MNKLSISRFWLALVLLTGCQSVRPVPFSFAPPTAGYHLRQPAPAGAVSEVELAQLTASLPDSAAADLMPARRSSYRAAVSPQATLSPQVLSNPTVTLPDTAIERLSQPPPVGKPDPLTTVVNVGGAVSLLGGVALIVAAANNDSGGYSGLGQVLLALPLLAIGVPLLLFQGKNGRRRKRREARIAARQPLAAPGPETTAANRPLEKLGLGMMIAAGLLLLLGLLGGIVGVTLAAFVGVPLAVIGLILFIAGS